jgi:predicted protein tyrosine phosphatase
MNRLKVLFQKRMKEYKDSANKRFGVIVVCNQQDEQQIVQALDHWFIPIHSILHPNQIDSGITSHIESILNESYSNERKEYQLVLNTTDNDVILLSHGIKTIHYTTAQEIVEHAFQVPRNLSGKQLTVTLVQPIQHSTSTLCVWHRPGSKLDVFQSFHEKNGITDIVCLLNEKEKASQYKSLADSCGITTHLFSLDGANVKYLSSNSDLLLNYANHIVQIVQSNDQQQRNILIHCSAGCHRTGTFAYLVLRLLGLEPERAKAALLLMRRETGCEVGQERIQLVENMIRNK